MPQKAETPRPSHPVTTDAGRRRAYDEQRAEDRQFWG